MGIGDWGLGIGDWGLINLLKNIFIKKDQERKDLLLKSFIKIYYNNISQINKTDKEEKSQEDIKLELLKKIFNNYNKNRGCILKIFTEKWILKSKILGMRAAARDKKKKRKLKKKNNKLISQNNLDIVNKNQEKKINMNNKFCKSIHEFSYIVSNGTIIKESSSNEQTEINVKNNKCSISSDKINKSKKFNKNVGLKKINSVNEINIQSNIKKEKTEREKEEERQRILLYQMLNQEEEKELQEALKQSAAIEEEKRKREIIEEEEFNRAIKQSLLESNNPPQKPEEPKKVDYQILS